MIRPTRTRIGAAATIAALGVSLATPAIDGAAAATTTPTLPANAQLTTALEALMTSGNASSVATEIQSLQADGAIDSVLNPLETTLGNLLGSLGTLLSELLSNPLASLESTIGSVSNLAPGGASSAVTQATAELKAALDSASLGSLLSGLSSDNGASAISQLAALQGLAPGASTGAGGLSSVGAIVSTLASEAGSGSAATTLNAVASALNSSSALTPSQLETLITELSSVTSTGASGTSGATIGQAAQALASQLAQSGSLLGGLAGVGSTLSALSDPGDLTSALNQLTSTVNLVPGADSPLGSVAAVLTAVAGTPGVSSTAAAPILTSLASTLSNTNGVDPTDLLSVISGLQGVSSSLPAPLNTLVGNLASSLSGSGSIFGTLPGLSSANAATALSELTSLSGLSLGAQTSLLPGLGSVLEQIGAQAPIAGTPAQTLLDNLGSAIATNPLTGAALASVAQILDNVASALPSPLNTTVSGLASLLSSDAAKSTGTTGTSTGTSTGNSGTSGSTGTSTGTSGTTKSTGTGSGTKSSTTSTSIPATLVVIPGVSGATLAKAYVYHWGLFRTAKRSAHAVTVTLTCEAAKGDWCNDTIKLNETGFHALTKKVRFRAGKTDKWTMNLKAIKTKKAVKKTTKRPAIKLTVTSGAYKVTKTLR